MTLESERNVSLKQCFPYDAKSLSYHHLYQIAILNNSRFFGEGRLRLEHPPSLTILNHPFLAMATAQHRSQLLYMISTDE